MAFLVNQNVTLVIPVDLKQKLARVISAYI